MRTIVEVEVNDHGDVVRIKGGRLSPDATFDRLTIGNVLQMWIRHPNGTATAGLFTVTYDYDPHSRKVARHVALISAGGSWAKEAPASSGMTSQVSARRQIQEAYDVIDGADRLDIRHQTADFTLSRHRQKPTIARHHARKRTCR